MSGRGLTSTEVSYISKDSIRLFHLVEMVFSSTLYFTTAPINLIYGANVYQSAGELLNVGDIKENIVPTIQSTNVVMSGVPSVNIAVMLSEDYVDAPVIITIITLNERNEIEFSRDTLWYIQKPSFSEDVQSGSAILTWHLANHFASFEQKRGMFLNENDHQRFYSGDTFLKLADQTQRNIPWGRKG